MAEIEIIEFKNHRFLFIDSYLWMWDIPEEVHLQKSIAEKAFGDVLVAGYGFGMVSKFLLENKNVNSVTTVEKYPEIIDKMKKFGRIHCDVVISYFFDLPEDRKFDCGVGDIVPEIDGIFLNEY